jgi:hypothetical protein
MWRTSSWIGIDGLIASYRQRHHGDHEHIRTTSQRGATGTALAVKTAA